MKNIWIIIKTNMKRNRMGILFAVLIGLMLCFFINSIGALYTNATLSKTQIGMIDHDSNSILSEDFKSYLTKKLNYELIEDKTYDQLSKELIEKKISAIIEIPEDFYLNASSGNLPEITFTALDDFENVEFLKAYINNYMESIHLLTIGAKRDSNKFNQLLSDYQKKNTDISQTAAVEIDKNEMTEKEGFTAALGFFLMLIFGVGIFTTFTIQDDRIHGVYQRIQITPVKPWQYIAGSAVFGMILNIIIITIFCSYIKWKDINTGIPYPIIVFAMLLFSLFTVCLSLLAAILLKSKNASASLIICFSTIGAILGGAYFPLDLAPKSLQNLARITPHFWFMDLFRSLKKDPNANIIPNIIILVLFTVLTFLIGAVVFSQNYKKTRQEV